jgi:DNA-binding transcriptional ArsR family regulator
MSNAPQIAEVAALVGDPARANMLVALLGGHALTATELAYAAGVSPQTTSGHLGKLSAARLVVLMKQGRHHYYRLTGPHVGHMLESIMHVAMDGPPRYQPRSKTDDQMRHARTCYDHIAGELGVGLADYDDARLRRARRRGGRGDADRHGILDKARCRSSRRACKAPGVLPSLSRLDGAGPTHQRRSRCSMAKRCFELKWIERARDSRALTITPAGRHGLMEQFALSI